VPVALNCIVDSKGIVASAGVTVMKTRGIVVTVTAALPEIPGVLVREVAVMVAVPAETAKATPLVPIDATDEFDELQATSVVISKLVPSEYVPVAINCRLAPTRMVAVAGVTAREDRVAEFTVRKAFPEIEGSMMEVAVMVTVPAETAKATPVLSIVATDVSDEFQVTCVAKVVPSEYVPVAVNLRGTPTGMLGLDGVTAREDRVAVFTVRVALAEILPEVAVMVAVPTETAKASPASSIVATDVSDELQTTRLVKSTLVPLLNVPVAVNVWKAPTGVLGLTGVTVREDRVAAFTVRMVLPYEIELLALFGMLEVAVMVVMPWPMAVARPLLLTVATDVLDEVQVTSVVISWLV
jgi:hypothetical protein